MSQEQDFYRRTIGGLYLERARLETEVARLGGVNGQLREQLREAQRLAARAERVELLRKESQDLAQKNEQLREDNASLREDNTRLLEGNIKLCDELARARKELGELNQENSRLRLAFKGDDSPSDADKPCAMNYAKGSRNGTIRSK